MTIWSAVALFWLSTSEPTTTPLAPARPESAVVVAPDTSAPDTSGPEGNVAPGAQPTLPLTLVETERSDPSTLPRPRLFFGVGAGAAMDSSGTVDGRSVPVPAFYISTGVGEGDLGFEAALCSTQASGRYRRRIGSQDDVGVDRSAIDLMVAVRPAWFDPATPTLPSRTSATDAWRSVAFDLGVAIERISASQQSAFRLGIVAGAHVDLVRLTPRDSSSTFALRLGMRRMFASPKVFAMPALTVSDTRIESTASLVASF